MGPEYVLSTLINNCKEGISKAYVSKGALETARSDFNLNTQLAVLLFIGNEGLESPCFLNSKEWENNPDPDNPIMVDAYSFCSGLIYGYIAFLYQSKTKKWIIKSFKKNREPDIRNLAFRKALSELQN